MNNKGYNKGQNRYIETAPIKTSIQVIDVLNEKTGFSGGWTHQRGSYFTIVMTLFTQLADGSREVEILHSYPKRDGRGWKSWLPVIKAVKDQGVIPELKGAFSIVKPASSKRRTVKEVSKFKISNYYTEEEFAQAYSTFTGKELPKNGPDLFD